MRFLPAIVTGILLIAANSYYLWEWRAEQLSGDVMIHLVFARNFAEGRWFEYSLGQSSRANTTILWEWILAVLGVLTGQIRSNEGFMTVARIFAVLCTAFTGWLLYRWGRAAQLAASVAALLAVFVVLNPVVFYWTAVNPMETCMTLVFTAALSMWVWREAHNGDPARPWRAGVLGGLWVFALSLIRPEMLPVGGVAALAFLFGQGRQRWPVALMLLAVPLLLTALQALFLLLTGVPIVPTPNTARRLIALKYDAFPLLGVPINPDSWKMLLSWAPLLLAALFVAFRGVKTDRPPAYFALGVCAWSAIFFSLYYYTTWQGRYMVPSLVALSVPSVAALSRVVPRHVAWIAGPAYGAALCLLLLRPLAAYADAPNQRALHTDFVPPPGDARVFLVQEVQSAYFYPHLQHISTEGLITPEAQEAHQRGLTLYEFIMELRPDLVSHGRYYLDDPDGLQEKINAAALAGEDLHYRDLTLTFSGQMPGAGHYFRASYPQ
ncbi:MAG: hypothetical protein IAE97_11570 [Chthoniobacterales bacterium]|nr:hypothetical protein [Chthoniobacterales bacterium]